MYMYTCVYVCPAANHCITQTRTDNMPQHKAAHNRTNHNQPTTRYTRMFHARFCSNHGAHLVLVISPSPAALAATSPWIPRGGVVDSKPTRASYRGSASQLRLG